jgi:diguanylate cyclase (GGDEF)-like protein
MDLRSEIHAAQAASARLAVFMMDLDGLKKINDSHGHLMGAFIISETGKKIGEILNPVGQACRYGGDEFVAYQRGASKDEALALGGAICEAIRGHTFEKDGVSLQVSISIVVAAFPEEGRTLETLTKAADDALYRAKAKGRNTASG